VLNPHLWQNGRFFRGQHHFYFAVWDGESVKLEPVTMPSACVVAAIARIFDRAGIEGPWLLCRSGEFVSAASGERLKLRVPVGAGLDVNSALISRSGHRVTVPNPRSKTRRGPPCGVQCDLTKGIYEDLRTFPAGDRDDQPAMPTWNLYRILESIARLPDGIALCGRRNRWRKITLDADRKLKIGDLATHDSHLSQKTSFSAQAIKTRFGCTLQIAEWPNGSKAFLDSRGLLHLKSHEQNVPEVSLILSDNDLAGWTSDGHVCGPQFFFDYIHHSVPEKVFEGLLKFLSHL